MLENRFLIILERGDEPCLCESRELCLRESRDRSERGDKLCSLESRELCLRESRDRIDARDRIDLTALIDELPRRTIIDRFLIAIDCSSDDRREINERLRATGEEAEEADAADAAEVAEVADAIDERV